MTGRLAMSGWLGGFEEETAFYVVADGTPVWTSDSCIPDQAVSRDSDQSQQSSWNIPAISSLLIQNRKCNIAMS